MKVCQLCPTLCGPGEWIVHGILQARILEWVAFPFSRGSSQPRDWTQASHIEGRFFYQLSHKGSPAVRWRGLGKLKDLTSSPQALKKDLRAEPRRGPRQTRRRSLRLSRYLNGVCSSYSVCLKSGGSNVWDLTLSLPPDLHTDAFFRLSAVACFWHLPGPCIWHPFGSPLLPVPGTRIQGRTRWYSGCPIRQFQH